MKHKNREKSCIEKKDASIVVAVLIVIQLNCKVPGDSHYNNVISLNFVFLTKVIVRTGSGDLDHALYLWPVVRPSINFQQPAVSQPNYFIMFLINIITFVLAVNLQLPPKP